MIKKIVRFILCLALPLIVGAISGVLTSNAFEDYAQLNQPPLSPPGGIFAYVWIALYILMGVGNYLIISVKESSLCKTMGLIAYYFQLGMNFIWSLIFFVGKQYWGALIWILTMWFIIIYMLTQYKKVSKVAMIINIPLVVWVTFAAYLNCGVAILN